MKSKIKFLENIFVLILVLILVYVAYLSITKYKFNYNKIIEVKTENKEEKEIKINNEEEMKIVVYDGLTLDELADKLNRSLNSTISGKGYLIANYSLEMNVDPYMATAIMLHETGCKWNCSNLVNSCNNVGGQKGNGCGEYSYFNSLDEGIKAFINNLSKNYINYGLTTPEKINHKYAEDPNWAKKVNKYIESIKAQ